MQSGRVVGDVDALTALPLTFFVLLRLAWRAPDGGGSCGHLRRCARWAVAYVPGIVGTLAKCVYVLCSKPATRGRAATCRGMTRR
jgi:hypothetical protein